MPLPDHVVSERLNSGEANGESSRVDQRKVSKGPAARKGIPMDMNNPPPSILSPILSHLPSLSGISSLKDMLPTSPQKQDLTLLSSDRPRATWQEVDLGDGQGSRHLLLLSTTTHALQIFTLPSGVIPDDPHVQESFAAPEEVFNLPVILYDAKTEYTSIRGGPSKERTWKGEQVLAARLMCRGSFLDEHGPLVALITVISHRRSSQSALGLAIVSLQSGIAVKHVSLGTGQTASLEVSSKAIAVAISHPSPSIHILDAATLAPIHEPVTSLPADPTTALPIFSLSHRLLAYVTSTPPAHPGADGLGSLITAQSTRRARPSTSDGALAQTSQVESSLGEAQGALLTSAVEIGGGVARGVWAGIKMGARAANRARNGRLAQSAPTEGSGTLADDEARDGSGDSESKSLEASSLLDEQVEVGVKTSFSHGVEWVKVVDLFARPSRPFASPNQRRRGSSTSRSPPASSQHDSSGGTVVLATIAHFRPPPSRSLTHPLPNQIHRRPSNPSRPQSISWLSFNQHGTQLCIAPADGRVQHIIELHPAAAQKRSVKVDVAGAAWHLYELRRGTTPATVCEVSWSRDGRWIGVGTGKGTIHIFPINSTGGPPSAASHATERSTNPHQLHPLSTVITPIARLRPKRIETLPDQETSQDIAGGLGIFAFTDLRRHPLVRGTICQDLGIFRAGVVQTELGRLSIRGVVPTTQPTETSPNQRKPSALTEMLRAKAGFGDGSDLAVDKIVKARWIMPLGKGVEEEGLVVTTPTIRQTTPVLPKSSLAKAEIQTHFSNPRILPGSIYLSRQVDFFAARPIDEFSPLSILDPEARVHRLTFRPEVEAQPTSPEVKSFDEPLLSALHSIMESPPNTQIPGLPNGNPYRNRWGSIPIRNVAAGLGEGVDRVKREYVRAQHSRRRRRASKVAANNLSFEDDAVMANGPDENDEGVGGGGGGDDDDGGSSPSSAVLPNGNTKTESSGGGTTTTTTTEEGEVGDDVEEEGEGWGAKWEEEYARAVEDDGGPEELVLGLMDEEEEERRKWQVKQKALARGYAK